MRKIDKLIEAKRVRARKRGLNVIWISKKELKELCSKK